MKPLYVQYGCGFSVGEGWLNFDSSPTLRIERIPAVGSLVGRLAGNSRSFPKEVRYGNICRGLPIAQNSVRGIYASHVLEHLTLEDFNVALNNTYLYLEPGGIFRLIVPDLHERARRYVSDCANGAADANSVFMRTTHLGREFRSRNLLQQIRSVLGGSAHLWMWDEPSMRHALQQTGFVNVQRCEFGDCPDKMFSLVEDRGRFLDQGFKIKELAFQAQKPLVS